MTRMYGMPGTPGRLRDVRERLILTPTLLWAAAKDIRRGTDFVIAPRLAHRSVSSGTKLQPHFSIVRTTRLPIERAVGYLLGNALAQITASSAASCGVILRPPAGKDSKV
jgi:hypothetical protein